MVPEEVLENQETTDGSPQSKSSITQVDHSPGMVESPASNSEAASTELPLNVHETLIGEENNRRTSHVANAILDQEFPQECASRIPNPASTLDVQSFARSDQGAQGSRPSSLVLCQDITIVAESGPQVENQTSRAASLGVVQPPNILYTISTANTSAYTSLPNNPMRQRPQICYQSFNDIFDHELEKLSREQGALRKNFEETTSQLMAELERKMAEARSEYDIKLQEVDAAYNTQAKEEEAYRSSVVMNSLLAYTFKSEYLNKSAATGTVAVRARGSEHSMEQRQEVQTNTHMNSTALPRPSVTATEALYPILSYPLTRIPHCHTSQPRPISQQEAMQSKTDLNPTTIPRPSVTSQRTTPLLHSPGCNTRQPRPLPLIPNHTPSSYSAASSPHVHGVVRAMAPHLRSSRTLNPAGASTTYSTNLVQEQQQQPQQRMTREQIPQQENLNSGLVCISDDDE